MGHVDQAIIDAKKAIELSLDTREQTVPEEAAAHIVLAQALAEKNQQMISVEDVTE
jgi:hypothetical protein